MISLTFIVKFILYHSYNTLHDENYLNYLFQLFVSIFVYILL